MRTLLAGLIMIGIVAGFQLTSLHAYESALMPSTETVKEVSTDHFRIVYQAPLADSVPTLAQACEEAYFVLTRIVKWTPKEKITVLYLDAYDTHNGWATATPRNTLAVYAAGPEQGSGIYQPGNYLRRTVFHELVHVLSLDRRSGYNAGLSKVFGKVYPMGDPLSYLMFLFTTSPNMLAPRWYLEGQSIWAESEFAGPGRGQSTLVDMILRCQVRDNTLLPPSRWYLETPDWPYGAAAYVYGMRMMQYLYESSEKQNPLGEITQNVSQAVLFNFDRGVRQTLGQSWKLLARDMLRQEKERQARNLQTLEQIPLNATKRLTPADMTAAQVVYSGSKIYLLAFEESKRPGLYVYDPLSAELHKIKQALGTPPFGVLSASLDGRRIFYTRLDIQGREHLWYEVRAYDTRTGRDTLVTRQGRYRAVDVSPDGQRLTAVSHRRGKAYLIETPLEGAGRKDKEVILARLPLGTDLAAPRYSPDGRFIAYVQADGKFFYLQRHDRKTGAKIVLYRSRAQIIAPTWHPDGQHLVFGSDHNGVYNLYNIPASGDRPPAPLTHVRGGLFFPSFSPDGKSLAAVGYDGHGPHLTIIPYAPEALEGTALPVIRPLWPAGKLTALKKEARQRQAGFALPPGSETHKPYNSFTSIRPDFWTPWLTASTFGVQGGVAAAFSDPTRRQDILLTAGAESEYGSPLASLAYTYRFSAAQLTLFGGAGQEAYPDLLVRSGTEQRFDYAEETRFGGITLSTPLWRKLEHQVLAGAGVTYQAREGIQEAEKEYAGASLESEPSEEDQSSLWARLVFFNGTVFNRSVSVEDGSLASVGVERAWEALGGDIDATRLRIDMNHYISMPYLENHVLKLSAAYARGWGDQSAQGLFGLGGFAAADVFLQSGVGRSMALRGYEPNFQTGQSVMRAGASYRFPIWNLFKGAESWFPVYGRSLFAEVFYEGGRAWDDENLGDEAGWLNAAGLEVNYGLTLLRFVQFAPGIGVVYAPQRTEFDEENEEVVVYLGFKLWYNF